MNAQHPGLVTPVYLNTGAGGAAPTEKAAYVLSGNGLFLHRNHPFFTSCLTARTWPGELGVTEPAFTPRYPRIPADQLERAVGFFAAVARLHRSEAALLIAWDTRGERIRLLVPVQHCTTLSTGTGTGVPVGVHYRPPPMPGHFALIGDMHSHVDGEARSSSVDRSDERYRPGLHIVVGRIHREPPAFCVEAVVDGFRFDLDPETVLDLAGYRKRLIEVPERWMAKVTVETLGTGAAAAVRANPGQPGRPVPSDMDTQLPDRYAGPQQANRR